MLYNIQLELNLLKEHIKTDDDEKLISVALSISRIADKKITYAINKYKKENNIKLTSIQKNYIRDIILGLKQDSSIVIDKIITDDDKLLALQTINKGIVRNKRKVTGTILAKLDSEYKKDNVLQYYYKISNDEEQKNQLLIIDVYDSDSLENVIKSNIYGEYDLLSNYAFMGIIFHNTSWDIITNISLFCENMKTEKNFGIFNRNKYKKIKELDDFVRNNPNIKYSEDIKTNIENFYTGVEYGFQFVDLFISSNDNTKILVFQKIELDESLVRCPDCMANIARGNSYPRLLQKSFECQNPHCPSRSKIGRGKRYDYFSVKRNVYLNINDTRDQISNELAKQYRKDIFTNTGNIYEMLIKFYSFHGNNVKILSEFPYKRASYGRHITSTMLCNKCCNTPITKLEKLLKSIIDNIHTVDMKYLNCYINNDYSIYNGNSSNILGLISEHIGGVITSPPYYNAREYSNWDSLLCYLIDMAINAKAVFDRIYDSHYYFYNIGDIVGRDNIYVSSHMSTKRIMLGFLSVLIFRLVGYNLMDNLIWYKGEVQSKRNSSENLFPTYVRPINCYEHILIFSKNNINFNCDNNIIYMDTVKKINSKGRNILGHTAPYPEELVSLIFPYIDKSKYILDPFLGSGTTVISCQKKGYKSVGIEINKEYYDLSIKRVEDSK